MKLFTLYITLLILLFLYSFTQVDLSLTFSRNEFLRTIVSGFQHIGYFQRPLSAGLYVLLLVGLFGFYLRFLVLAKKKQLSKQYVWKLVLVSVGILTLSYNAFSYDLFNYIFDAKIITFYQQNPYLHKPLDFVGDPMLSFMHWTHRTYPYGPIWLVLTVPLSFLGFQFFLPTFALFKLLMAGSFLGSLYFIGKILQKIAPQRETVGLVFFGLSPLLLIESVVSSHVDIVMLFFALWAFYLLVQKKHLWALVLLLLSIGIKFVTVFLLPVFLLVWYFNKRGKKIVWDTVLLVSVAFLFLATLIVSFLQGTFQPWYLIAPLCFAALASNRFLVVWTSIILSLVALLSYLPFLYLGNWNSPVPVLLLWLYGIGVVVSIGGVLIVRVWKRK